MWPVTQGLLSARLTSCFGLFLFVRFTRLFQQITEVVCFASGTRIKTNRGDIAVESLVVGDMVVCVSGTHGPIRWLGHRTIDCRHHPRSSEVMPIRIAANAFGSGGPARDLYVSPGHAICIDVMGGVLIPSGSLENGTTIARFIVETVTYWHVELDEHEIVLAEDLQTESYLEMGNRGFFAESDIVMLLRTPDAFVLSHYDFCRPYHATGSVVNAVRSRLAARADATHAERITHIPKWREVLLRRAVSTTCCGRCCRPSRNG